jgi:predicted  nucleic acid-binding Zn-ribbon protein
MAAGEYVKSAVSSLYQASTHLRQQAKEMQASVIRVKDDKKSLMNKDAVKIKTSELEQSGIKDSSQRSRLAMQIEKMQQEIMAAQKELEKTEKELIDAANAKIDAAIGIETQAKQLEDQASRID